MPVQQQRMEIFRQVRIILVRQMIDIGRLSIQVSVNHLYLRGTFGSLPGAVALTPDVVRAIFAALGRITGVRWVDADFINWRRMDESGGVWVEVPVEATSTVGRKDIDQGGNVFTITVKEPGA